MSLRFLSIFLILPLFLIIPAVSHAATTTCTDVYSKDATVPTGYGAAYNLFSSAKELLVKTNSCTDTSASIAVGNGDAGMYVYKNGYYWNGSNWTLFALRSDSEPVSGGNWYLGTATYALPLVSGSTYRYYVGYTCQKVSDVWKCGCHDTTCSTASWQLQRVNKTSSGSSGPVCGNGVCESGENTSSCSQDCKAAGSANVIINYAAAASPGALNHVAAGFLHGMADANNGTKYSPTSLWTDLDVRYLRTWPNAIAPTFREDARLHGGTSNLTMVVVVSDGWKPASKPAPWGSDYNNPDYSAYLNYVVGMANGIKATVPVGQRVYDFWNEPDIGHFYGDWDAREAKNGYPRFKELWVLFYKLFKQGLPGYNNGQPLDPGAKITAPGTSAQGDGATGGDAFTKDFMTYAIQHNAIPDYWNWHGGGANYIDKLNVRLNYARSLGGDRDALVLEYLMRGSGAIGQRPGAAIYEIAQMEQGASTPSYTGYKFATNARWPVTSEAGNSLFLDGGQWKKHGIWYLYADYAKMKGNRATLTSSWSTKVNAVVSIDSASKKAWALMGNEKIQTEGATTLGTLTTRASGIKSADGSGKVYVTVSRIPYDNFGEVTDAEVVKVINNAEYTVTDNAIDVAFPWDRADNGYFMEISNVIPQ